MVMCSSICFASQACSCIIFTSQSKRASEASRMQSWVIRSRARALQHCCNIARVSCHINCEQSEPNAVATPHSRIGQEKQNTAIRSLRNGAFSGTAPFPGPPRQSTDSPHPGGAIRRAGAGERTIVGSPRPFFSWLKRNFSAEHVRRGQNGKRRDAGSEPPTEIAAAIDSRAQWLWIVV